MPRPSTADGGLGPSPTPPRTWFERDPVELAALVLGGVLTRSDDAGTVALRLTEVEAYRGSDDPGAHTFRGRTARNATMFGPGGHLYCYFTYGMHHALNVVAGPEGSGWGVLVRAGEIVEGRELAMARRSSRPRKAPLVEPARGPGNVAQCFAATLADDGADLLGPTWSFVPAATPPSHVSGPRVGVSGPGGDGVAFPWRLWLPGEPSVSAYRPGTPRRGRRRATSDGI